MSGRSDGGGRRRGPFRQFVANLDDAPLWIPSNWLPRDMEEGGEEEAEAETALEREIANLASGILTNLATHPDNRTRFYKLELRATLGDSKERMQADKTTDSGRRCPPGRSPNPPFATPAPPCPRGPLRRAQIGPARRVGSF